MVAVQRGEPDADAAEEQPACPAGPGEEVDRRRDRQVHHHFAAERRHFHEAGEQRHPGRRPSRFLAAGPSPGSAAKQERRAEHPKDAEDPDRPEIQTAGQRIREISERRLDLDQVAVRQEPLQDARAVDEVIGLVDVEHAERESRRPQQRDHSEQRPWGGEKLSHPVDDALTPSFPGERGRETLCKNAGGDKEDVAHSEMPGQADGVRLGTCAAGVPLRSIGTPIDSASIDFMTASLRTAILTDDALADIAGGTDLRLLTHH